MDTRRIRRLERRRLHRTAIMVTSVAVIGVAVGTALPRNLTASVVLLVAALGCLVVVAMSNPAIAPLHGLHRVVRLPWRTSLTVTVHSFASRLVGTIRTIATRRPTLVPIVLDEPDDDAEEWWGAAATPADSAPALPAPVLAAPMPSAHVPSADAHSIRARAAQLALHARRWVEPLTKRHGRPTDGAGAST